MKYIAITRNEIYKARSLKALNKRMNGKIEHTEMSRVGDTWIVRLDEQDLDFVRDKKKLANAFLERLHKKDNKLMLLVIANMLMTFVAMIR